MGNLQWEVTAEHVRAAFEDFGEVQEVTVIRDRTTGHSLGYGFVEMQDQAAKVALDKLRGVAILGREIRVSVAHPKPDHRRNMSGRPPVVSKRSEVSAK